MSLEAAIYNEARLARIAAEAGSAPSLKLSVPFFTSGTWTAPQDGVLEFRGMGAGGAGAASDVASASATGGYSGAWGAKLVRVRKSDVVTVTLGAGGAAAGTNLNGNAGGSCVITVGGVTYTAPGGLGGRYAATGVPAMPAAPELPAGWDIGANSVKPGVVSGRTGGAGVNIFMQAGDATTSASSHGSGGGGTGGASLSTMGGGAAPGGASASGELTPTGQAGAVELADNGEWVISFFGGSGGRPGASGYRGGNGGGGGSTTGAGYGGNGGNGGGGGSVSATTGGVGGTGGYGGGGGAGGGTGGGTGGPGGNAYACLHFYPDTGV